MSDDVYAGGGARAPEGKNLFDTLGIAPSDSSSTPTQEPAQEGRNLFEMLDIKPQVRMERTWGEAAGDTGLQLLEGANSLVGGAVSLVAPESGAAAFYNNNVEYLRGQQSPVMQRKMKRVEEEIAKADKDSILDQAGAAAGAYANDGAMMARLAVTNLPSMIPGIGAAKVGQAAALARGATAAKAAAAGTTAAGLTNGVLNAGSARGQAYEEIKDSLAKSGMRPEDIEAAAIEDSKLPALVGGVVGVLSGKSGLESALVSGGLAKGGIRSALTKGATELAGEQAEEIAPKVTTNYVAGQNDGRALTRDVGRTAVETAVGAGPSTGVTAALAGLNRQDPTTNPTTNYSENNSNAPAPSAAPAAPAAATTPPTATTATAATTQASTAQSQQAQQQPAAIAQTAQQAAPAATDVEAEADAATARLAELEVLEQSMGLNSEEQRERMLLVHRLDELDEANTELPPEFQAQAPTQAPTQANAQQIDPADLPDAGIDVGQGGNTAPAPNFDHVKTWPQFVLANGMKVEGLKKNSPDWVALQSGWQALKTQRAGLQPQGNGQAAAPKQEIQNRDRSRPASVMQMQQMAQSPDYGRLGISRSPETGAPMVFAEGDALMVDHTLGRDDVAVMSDGQRVKFTYAVMDAADVHPSNFADGSVNPQFDAKVLGTVKALNNGRTAGLRAAYERGTAQGYKQELMADEAMHGISAQAIEAMQSPMLVRLYSEKDNQHNMGVKSQSQALGLSAAEQASTDAHLMDSQMLDMFETGALDGQGNQDFVRGFVGRLQAAGQDVAEMMDAGGRVSPKGVQRMQAAMVHKAYDDGDLVETMFGSTDNDIRAIGEALKSVAGEWAYMRHMVASGAVNPQVDLTANVLQAVRLIQQARRDRTALVDLVNQVDIETGDVVTDLTVGMLRLMYDGQHMTRARGRDAVAEGLRQYVNAAMATTAQGGDMFGEVVGPEQIVSALTGMQVQPQAVVSQEIQGASTQEQTQASTQNKIDEGEVNGRTDTAQQAGATDQPRATPSSDTAGGGDDSTGTSQPQPAAGTAGQGLDETSGRGQGQDAQDRQQQQDSAGGQRAAEGGDSRLIKEPAAQELQSYTAEEIRAQQQAQSEADKAQKDADAQAAKAEQQRKDKAEIAARQEASADNFQLGQSAMDSLAGQKSVFDEPAQEQAPKQAPKQEAVQEPGAKPQSADDIDLDAMFDRLLDEEAAPDTNPQEKATSTGHKAGDVVVLGKGRNEATIRAIRDDGTVNVALSFGGMKSMSAADFSRRYEEAQQAQADTEAEAPMNSRAPMRPAINYRDPATGATWTGRGKAPAWIQGKDYAQYEVPTTDKAKAPKQATKQTEAAKKRQAEAEKRAKISAEHLNGAKTGDTITASKDFDYVTGGKPMVIESISTKGEVFVRDPVRGGATSFSASMASARGVTFEVRAPAPTVGQSLASAASNTAAGLTAAIDGLGALFGGGGKFNSGLAFDENTYAKAKPLFQQAIANLGDAGKDLEAAMRAVIRMVNDKFGREVTANMKPYVVRFIKEVSESNQDAPSAPASVERHSTESAPIRPDAGAVQRDTRDTPGDDGQASGRASAEAGGGQQNDASVSVDSAALAGKRSDQRLHHGVPAAGLESGITGADYFDGVPADSGGGVSVVGATNAEIAALVKDSKPVDRSASNGADAQSSKQVTKQESKQWQDIAYELGGEQHAQEVRDAVPMLLPGQVEDVVKAEVTFSKPDVHGMLFTNGTGTGKTFTGLGVVKRFNDAGKSNVLMLAPDDKIAADWIDSAKLLGLKATQLENTKDAGEGVVITTYANLGENNALASRQWDLVVPDEAHTLMSNQQGEQTLALERVRALTFHPRGLWSRMRMVHADDYAKASDLREQIKEEEAAGDKPKAQQLKAQLEMLEGKLQAAHDAMKVEFENAAKDGKRAKLLALSATPFAYEKNVEWAEGYLFSYDEGRRDDEREFRGYNEGGNRERFFMQHFGYRMRFNKLTEPDANVDRGIMQRQFNTWLKQRGVLSTRLLDVKADYDRRFVLFESAIGNRIDEALGYIAERAKDDKAFSMLQTAVDKSLDYQSRRYLLEAIKAKEAVGIVREHMKLGRKVVVFHDFIKGGGKNPFDIEVSAFAETAEENDALRSALRDFDAKFGDLKRAKLHELPSPVSLFKQEFPELLLVNGQVKPKASVLTAYKTFNDDDNGPQVMLVQSAKDKGWSGHDTTGKHQRVLINLGLPTAPTKAIQQEGRIYRTGQVSDAIMRYLNTGTSWERTAFATTIATRAATAENLALGELARSLQDSFIEAFEQSASWEPGHEGEGKGGKEIDRARNSVVTEWDRAKSLYWAQQKKTSKTKAAEGTDYFATPEPLGLKMVEWAGVVDGESTLEPSAGHGAIARWFPETARRTMVELSPELRSRLALAGFKQTDRIVAGTFEDLDISNKYDAIVMNPPFGTAGRLAVDHMAKAYKHLREGGRMVALLPVGSADKKLESWLYEKADKADKDGYVPFTKPELHRVADLLMPGSTFGRAGTGVMTRIVIIDKLAKGEEPTHAHRTVDMRDETDINSLFERLEYLDMPVRAKKKQALADKRAELKQQSELESTQASAPASKQEPVQVAQEGEDKAMLPRDGRQTVEHFTAKGKRLVGVIFHGSKEDAMRYDPYTLKKDGGWFIREKHVIDDAGEQPVFMRNPLKSTPRLADEPLMSVGQQFAMAQSVVEGIRKTWKSSPPVVVVPSMDSDLVPKRVRDYNEAQIAKGATGNPQGFYYGGIVYIVADQHTSEKQVATTLFHEALGHAGLRLLFGKGLTAILEQVFVSRPREVNDIAGRYGLDLSRQENRMAVAEEVLTHMAQEKPELGFVGRAVVVIRKWLRANVPSMANLRLSNSEIIQDYLLPARARIEKSSRGFSADEWDGRIDPYFLRSMPNMAAMKSAVQGTSQKWAQGIKELVGYGSWDEFIYHWQDRFVDLKRIQARITEHGGSVSEANDVYTGEELFHKRMAKRVSNFLRDELNPLLRELEKTGVSLEDFERFLHARHATEANRVMAERNPDQPTIDKERVAADQELKRLRFELQRSQALGLAVTGIQRSITNALMAKGRWDGAQAFKGTEDERLALSGMTDQEAANIMNSYPADVRSKLDALGAKVDAMNDATLDTLGNYGLMDAETLQAWRSTYQHYVPLHRDEAHPESKAHPVGQGFSTRGAAAKQRTGSNAKVTNILAHIAMQREAAIVRGEKNNVAKRLYTLAAQNPDPELWSLKPPKKKVIDPSTGLVKVIDDFGALHLDNVLMVRIGGKDKHIIFNPRNERAVRLGMAMRNLDATELDRFTRVMGRVTRWFASVNTQYNPVFSVFNFTRDIQGAMLQLSSTELAGEEKQVLKGVMKATPVIWRELRNARKNAGAAPGMWAQLWENMQLDGGTTGFTDLYADPADRAKSLQKAIDQMGQGNARSAPRELMGVLSDFNETLEGTTRLAVYKIALDKGLSRQRAASIAKNITVNFNRKGRNMSVVGSYYAFMNAAIQGSVRLGQTLAGPRGKQIIMGGVALGMLSAFAGQMVMGGDGADDEWNKIPEFVKERSIIIPLSGKDYVAIPMPLGFHVFPNIGRKVVEFGLHDDPHKSRMSHIADMLLASVNAFNPLGGADNFMQMLAPTPFDPVAALMENKDWTGRSIYREQTSHLDPKPGHDMAKESTNRFVVSLSRAINAATGGNDWQRGALSLNPDAIEYVFGQLTGGVGRELAKAGNSATALATGDELAAHKVPLLGRVYGNTRGVNGQSDGFYSNLQRINVAESEAKGRYANGETVDAALQAAPLAQLGTAGNLVQKRVKELGQLRNRVLKSDVPDKTDQVKLINQEIESVMHSLNQAADDVARKAAK